MNKQTLINQKKRSLSLNKNKNQLGRSQLLSFQRRRLQGWDRLNQLSYLAMCLAQLIDVTVWHASMMETATVDVAPSSFLVIRRDACPLWMATCAQSQLMLSNMRCMTIGQKWQTIELLRKNHLPSKNIRLLRKSQVHNKNITQFKKNLNLSYPIPSLLKRSMNPIILSISLELKKTLSLIIQLELQRILSLNDPILLHQRRIMSQIIIITFHHTTSQHGKTYIHL